MIRALICIAVMTCVPLCGEVADTPVRLMTLDPGHFHAALVQKFMYPKVNPVVHVFSPGGPDLEGHLKRIDGFNTRSENPTAWKELVYQGPDFLAKMIRERPGNVVVISGNNALKSKYILDCVQAGLNVLADKPMAITPEGFELVREAFTQAAQRHVLLCDIMPERYEITTVLQRELSRNEAVFGRLEAGTPEKPSVVIENVHHFYKQVAGKTLARPPWFFDPKQQGEGIVDVMTHLVDLVQWGSFPEQSLSPEDAKVLTARRWPTRLTLEQFQRVTGATEYPDYLRPYAEQEKSLELYCNGAFTYTLRGVHARVSVEWRFEPVGGLAGDTHDSLMRGTKCVLAIRQGREENWLPTLYVEKRPGVAGGEFDRALRAAVSGLAANWPGVDMRPSADGWVITIPDQYKVGHEAHFAQVTAQYLKSLANGKLPDWEVPNMLTKYSTIMQAYQLSRPQ